MTARCALYVGALKIFHSPWVRPRLLLPKFLMGFCSDRSYECANFVVHSFTHSWENRGYSKNVGSPWIRPCSLFSQTFCGLLFGWILWMYRPNLQSVVLPVPEIAVLGWGCEPQSWGRGGRRGSWMVPFERALVNSYRRSITVILIYLYAFQRLPLLCSSTALFRTPPLVSPKFPHVPLGLGGWPFGYEERRYWANCPCN